MPVKNPSTVSTPLLVMSYNVTRPSGVYDVVATASLVPSDDMETAAPKLIVFDSGLGMSLARIHTLALLRWNTCTRPGGE